MKHDDVTAATLLAALQRFATNPLVPGEHPRKRRLTPADEARVSRAAAIAQIAIQYIDGIVRHEEIATLRKKWNRGGKEYRKFNRPVSDHADRQGDRLIDGMFKLFCGEDPKKDPAAARLAVVFPALCMHVEDFLRRIEEGVPAYAGVLLWTLRSIDPQLCDLVPTYKKNAEGKDGDVEALAALLDRRVPTTLRVKLEKSRLPKGRSDFAQWIAVTILLVTKPASLGLSRCRNRDDVAKRIWPRGRTKK